MDRHLLFLETIDHLQECLTSREPYQALQVAGLLRKLLMDGAPLLDQANRGYRERITFRVALPTPPSGIVLDPKNWIAPAGLDPEIPRPDLKIQLLGRAKFLSTQVGVRDATPFSISDLIAYGAHVLGGVHAGSPRSPADFALDALRLPNDAPPSWDMRLVALRTVGRIVLRALQPLRLRILEYQRFESAPGISLHLVVSVGALAPPAQNFILDLGTDAETNRLSVYVDEDAFLRLRLTVNAGQTTALRAGLAGSAYAHDRPMYVRAEVGVVKGASLLLLEAAGWTCARVLPSALPPDSLAALRHSVIGSDLHGRAPSRMVLFERIDYDRIPSSADANKIRAYIDGRIRAGYNSGVAFEAGQFLHSDAHPNFPEGSTA